MGVGKTSVKMAKQIVRQAPELREDVVAGVLSLREAQVLAPFPLPQRQEMVQQLRQGTVRSAKGAILALKKAQIAAQAVAEPSKPLLTKACYEQWLAHQPPCDLLLTDPPYATEVEAIEAFAQQWLPLALARVKPTGRAYVCVGASPEELRAYLNVQGCLPIQQILVWEYQNTLGPVPTYRYKQNWQAILSFCGPDAPPLDCPLMIEQWSVQSINAPDGRLGDRYHTWQKPDALAERLIRHSSKPGDRVIDCFAGTGTFLLAAHRLGRIAQGCEPSERMLAIAEQRGCAIARGG